MSFEAKITDYGQIEGSIQSPYVVDIMTLAVAKNYIKQAYGTDATEDTLLASMIKSARVWIEGYINQSVIKKQCEVYTRDELAEFRLPFGPVQTISEVVRIDYTGAETALVLNTDYYVDGLTHKRLYLYHVWSTGPGAAVAGIKATYLAYMDIIPAPIITACQMLVAENYYHRGDSTEEPINFVPFKVRDMLNPFRRVIL